MEITEERPARGLAVLFVEGCVAMDRREFLGGSMAAADRLPLRAPHAIEQGQAMVVRGARSPRHEKPAPA